MSMHLSDYSMYNVDFFSFAAVLTVSNWRSSSDIVLITRKDHWKDQICICIHVHANLDCVPIFVCLLLLLLCWRCMHLWIKVMLVHVFNVHSLIHIFCIHRAMCVIWVTSTAMKINNTYLCFDYKWTLTPFALLTIFLTRLV